jgi:hypothetical protein
MEHFEDNLSKFSNDENIADDKKKLFLLQDALRRLDKHKPYHVRAVNKRVIDHKKETSHQDSAAGKITKSKEEELNSIASNIESLLPHPYRKQSKGVATFLMLESYRDHPVKVDSDGKRIIIQGKGYNLLDLI